MIDPFVRLQLLLAGRRKLVVLLVVVFAVASLLCGRRLKLNEDFTDMLPMSDPAIAGQVEALKHVRQVDRLFVDVHTLDGDQENLLQAADRMADALRSIPGLGELRYTVEETYVREMFEDLQAQLPALLSSNDLRELEPRFTPAALENRLAWLKQAMTQPQGLMFKDIARTDPVGLGDLVGSRLRALRAGVGDASVVAGRITSKDGRHVLISAAPGFRPAEFSRSAPLIASVLRSARAVEAAFPHGSVRISVTGAHRMALDNATIIRKDTVLSSLVATVAVAALMFGAYRRRWLALLGLAPTLFGALGALLLFYLTGDAVSAVALGCGSILVGVTVDYGIYILYHTDDQPPATREQRARAVAELAPTLAFGALTTMAAFLVMLVSPVSGHRQLGLFGAVGVALAALFAMVVLPLFIPVGDRGAAAASRTPHVLPLTRAMRRLFAWRDRRARIVLPLLLAFSCFSVWGILRLRFEGDFSQLNGISNETRRDEAAVRETWGKALSLTTVIAAGATREEALQQNERVWATVRSLQENKLVDSFSSIAPLVPSEQTRRANQQAWQAFWTEERRRNLSHALTGAAAKLGFQAAAFAAFNERLAAPAVATTGAAENGPLARLLSDYWTEKDGRVSICTLIKTADGDSFLRLRESIRREAPGAWLLNRAALSDDIIRIARRALPVFAVLVAALNAALLFLLLGRVELVLITLLPMAAGLFWALGTLGLLGQPIDMANFIFAIFVVGVGGDYSLFTVMAELEPLRGSADRTASTGGAVTICAGTTLLGVGVLVLARHPAMFSIGLSALLGITLTLIATLFLVPPCMARLRRKMGASAAAFQNGGPAGWSVRRRRVGCLYRYQGPYVSQFVYWKTLADPLFKAVDRVVPLDARILDLGSGYGIVANWLTFGTPGRTVVGIDLDEAKVRVARRTAELNPRVSFETRDVLSWEYSACDCVLMFDLLHYLPYSLKQQVLRKAFAALKAGGRLVIRDAMAAPNSKHRLTAWSEKLAVFLGQNKTSHGLHFETLKEHQLLLHQAGFAQVETISDSGLGSNRLLVCQKN